MLIPIRTLEEIAAGRVDLAFRRWARPAVKAGGSQRTAIGVVRFDAVDPVELADVTDDEARRAGFADRAALAAELARHRDGQLYRIRLHREGDDPRIALREDADARPTTTSPTITTRLDRLDRASSHGAWTRATLDADPGPTGRARARSRRVGRPGDAAVQARRPQAQEPRPDDQPPRGLRTVATRPRLPRPHRTGDDVTTMDPMIARRTWRTVEPLHGMIYFSPEAAAAFDALGPRRPHGLLRLPVRADGRGRAPRS